VIKLWEYDVEKDQVIASTKTDLSHLVRLRVQASRDEYLNLGVTVSILSTKVAGGYTFILTPDATGSHWGVSGTCLQAGLCKT